MKTFLPLMTSVEAREAAERGAVAILPLGTIEGNGAHQVLGFDYLMAAALAERAAARSGDVWLPPVTYGVSEALLDLPGTIAVPHETFAALVEAVVTSLIQHGFDHVLLLNSHIPNQFPAEYACRRIRRRTGVLVASISPGPLASDLSRDLFPDGRAHGHGGEPGTSLMLHLHPESVRMDLVRDGHVPAFQGLTPLNAYETRFRESKVNLYLDMGEVSDGGAVAAPRDASAATGEEVMRRMVDFVVEFLDRFRTMDTRARPPG
jgi:creatinine amidohydrolase